MEAELTPAAEAVVAVLPHGAANRGSDLTRPGSEVLARVLTIEDIGRGNRKARDEAVEASGVPTELAPVLKDALNGVIVGAGNCLEHASISFFKAIALYPGKRILKMNAVVEGKSIDHAFVLVVDPGANLNKGMVIDPWQKNQDGRRLDKSAWAGSHVFKADYIANGTDYIALALEHLEIDHEELLKRINQNAGRGNKFKVYHDL